MATQTRCGGETMSMHVMRLAAVLFVLVGIFAPNPAARLLGGEDKTPNDVFNERILPIFRSPNPSSCVQCHLASVDLKDYILPSSEQTFVSLRDQGLVSLEKPDQSKILKLIRMGNQDADAGARLIHENLRQAELQAFSAWIAACCKDDRLRELPPARTVAGPSHPDEVIRHARRSRIVDSFVRNVWSQRMRCFPCHTPHEIDPENPRHRVARTRQKELAEKYNVGMLRRLHFFRKTPEETLEYLLRDSQKTPAGRLPLINVQEPEKSLIVLKPMAKLPKRNEEKALEPPSYVEPVSHMGGLKMHKHDQSYKSFLAWLRDYSKLSRGGYTSVDDLPADNWHATQKVLRVRRVPESWSVGTIVQTFVYRTESGATADEPVAFTQGTITPRRIVNGTLFLLGSTERDGRAAKRPSGLRPGDYVLKVFVDRRGKVRKNPAAMLTMEDFVGQITHPAKWRNGFKRAEMIDARKLHAGRSEAVRLLDAGRR